MLLTITGIPPQLPKATLTRLCSRLLKSEKFSFGPLAAAVGLEIAKPSVPDVALQTWPWQLLHVSSQLSFQSRQLLNVSEPQDKARVAPSVHRGFF